MDDDMQAMEVRDREIEFRLEAYARARLSPDPAAVARSRARIMREARLQFEASQRAAALAPPIALAPRRPVARRVAMPLLAAGLWAVLTVGSVFAAQPGGPLYPARMWIEGTTLPSSGAPRVNAEIGRLEARLAEVGDAAARGDEAAVEAALDAYRQIADGAIAATNGDESLEAILAAALDKHRAVLTAVATKLAAMDNDTAAAAVEAAVLRAIVHNQAVIDRVDEHRAGGGSGPVGGAGTKPGTGPGSGGAAGGAAGGAGGPGAGGPASTPAAAGGGSGGDGGPDKPAKSPRPTKPPTPDPTQPDHTPRGQDQ
jgi:hypothetical protein